MAIFVLSGTEPFLKEEILSRLKTHLQSTSTASLDCTLLYADSPNNNIADTLRSGSLFAENKLVLIKNAERLSENEKKYLLTYAKAPSKHTYVVLDTEKNYLENRFLSDMAKYAKVNECNKLPNARLYSWIYKYTHDRNKKISKDAAGLLVELKGNNLRTLAMELDKLITYLDSRQDIAKRDVENLVEGDVTRSVFDLVDAVSSRDFERSLNLIQALSQTRRSQTEIIGLLGWQFKRLWKAKKLEIQKTSKLNIAKTIRVPARFSERFFNQLNHFEIDTIKRNIRLLVQADRDLKTGRGDKELILELLAVKLCA